MDLRLHQDAFRETPTEATGAAIPAALAGVPADTPVMMYCTGGIRCDIYSTHLRKQGFTCADCPALHEPSTLEPAAASSCRDSGTFVTETSAVLPTLTVDGRICKAAYAAVHTVECCLQMQGTPQCCMG